MDNIKFVREMDQYLKAVDDTVSHLQIAVIDFRHLLMLARDAAVVISEHERMRKTLSRMSREDYRGNRPQHVTTAFEVLRGVKKRV